MNRRLAASTCGGEQHLSPPPGRQFDEIAAAQITWCSFTSAVRALRREGAGGGGGLRPPREPRRSTQQNAITTPPPPPTPPRLALGIRRKDPLPPLPGASRAALHALCEQNRTPEETLERWSRLGPGYGRSGGSTSRRPPHHPARLRHPRLEKCVRWMREEFGPPRVPGRRGGGAERGICSPRSGVVRNGSTSRSWIPPPLPHARRARNALPSAAS